MNDPVMAGQALPSRRVRGLRPRERRDKGPGPASVGTAPSFPSSRRPTPRDWEPDAQRLDSLRESRLTFQSGPSTPHVTRHGDSAWISPSVGSAPTSRKNHGFQNEDGKEGASAPPIWQPRPPHAPPPHPGFPHQPPNLRCCLCSELETTEPRAWQLDGTMCGIHCSPQLPEAPTPGILRPPRVPSPGGLSLHLHLHLSTPQRALMKGQWCKIRWGEKQEVEPESKAAETLPGRWPPFHPQPYRKVARGQPQPGLWGRGVGVLVGESRKDPSAVFLGAVSCRANAISVSCT